MLSLLLAAAAAAAPLGTISLEVLPVAPAAPDRQARGPGELAAGPDGLAALVDPVQRELVILQDGSFAHAFAVDRVTDLAWTETGRLLALDGPGRTLILWSATGELLDTAALPGLVPQGITLVVEGDEVLGADVFGNLHPLALSRGPALSPPQDTSLRPGPGDLHWSARTRTLTVGDRVMPLPEAIEASAQRFGDWLVIEEVTQDHPIPVRRTARHLGTGHVAELPVEGRTYVPDGDLALRPDGALLFLDPTPTGLRIDVLEVQP